jgi:NAD(P)-dependent dehydrogenase (short-subunit alcohol dehydrogenase family)
MDTETAVVIGGSSGIGLATAGRLIELGATVTIAGRSLERLQAASKHLLGPVTTATLDCTDAAAVAAFFAATGSIDHVIVSLAGGAALGPFTGVAEPEFRSTFDGKFWPYVNVMREAAPRLNTGGSMTLVTGASAIAATPGAASLAAVNGALEGMIKTLAVELAPLRVNAVSPGLTDTAAWHRIPDDIREKMYAKAAAETPAGRVGQADDVAQAIVAVVSNPFLTGLVLPCDGGKRLT